MRIATMSSEVATGRKMNILERFTTAGRGSLRPFFAASLFSFLFVEHRSLRRLYFCAFARAIHAVYDPPLAGLHAGVDRREWSVGRSDLDRPHRHRVVLLRDVDEHALRAALHGGRRHDGESLARLDQHAHV